MKEAQLHLFKSKKQRGTKPRKGPDEFPLTCQVADLLDRWIKPSWKFSHFPSGELRTEATGARLKRMGLKTGWPDFLLVSPKGEMHCLELKRYDGVLSDAQKDFRDWALAHGVPYVVARTLEAAAAALNVWGCLRGRVDVQ